MPHFTSVQRLRLRPDEVEPTVEEVRGHVLGRGHTHATWWLGDSTRPDDLHERLVALGFTTPADGVGELVSLALASPSAPAPADVAARPVASFEEYVAAAELRWEVFEVPAERRETERAGLAGRWENEQAAGLTVVFVTELEGRIAATASGIYAPAGCLLVGGATAPWARGRGAYRALVRARWDEAARRGTPGLAVEALTTSEPILRGLGFEQVTRLRRLEDPATV
jgi:hypothetical protein